MHRHISLQIILSSLHLAQSSDWIALTNQLSQSSNLVLTAWDCFGQLFIHKNASLQKILMIWSTLSSLLTKTYRHRQSTMHSSHLWIQQIESCAIEEGTTSCFLTQRRKMGESAWMNKVDISTFMPKVKQNHWRQ